MPANLTPAYKDAEERYRAAQDPDEKLKALREMLSIIPKHKGTEKLQADIKKRMSQLKVDVRSGKSGPRRVDLGHVPREGAGQVALIGPPNSGKSSLLASLTHAHPEIADYPFTTRKPGVGMMPYKDIQVQLVDTPAIAESFMESWVLGIVRNADLALCVLDAAAEDLLDHLEVIRSKLSASKLKLCRETERTEDEQGWVFQNTLLLANRIDLPGAPENLEVLNELFASEFDILSVSAKEGIGLDDLRERIFRELSIIRVYTKARGKKADLSEPYVLKLGSTVLDAAATVHRDIANSLQFAKIWGKEMFDGQMVNREFVLRDGDVLEFHA